VKEGRPYLPMRLDEEAISRGIREKVRATQPKPKVQPVVEKNGCIEVDLHIDALLDTTAGMDNAAMLQYQLETFRRTMETYRQCRGQKIVFIHGKGEGVLRKAILDELKAHYQGCEWQDASFRQYGFGATMVTIHKK
jgi:dsDNA-specific endonuclease/ATPase MutS2